MSNDDFRVRGYMALNAASYLRLILDESNQSERFNELPAKVRETLGEMKPATWCDIATFSEITRAIAASANGDEDRARELLINCGTYMGKEATNSYLRMMMKLLTVKILAKKIPDLWRRDCTQGDLTVEAIEKSKMTFRARNMAGFDHVACTSAGFLTFVLKAMGKEIKETKVYDWSIAEPCIDGAKFEVSWA